MNKRELIKALFKNPTIMALYESGQFNAADINRAILTEAMYEYEGDPKEKVTLLGKKITIGKLLEILNYVERAYDAINFTIYVSQNDKHQEFMQIGNMTPEKFLDLGLEFLVQNMDSVQDEDKQIILAAAKDAGLRKKLKLNDFFRPLRKKFTAYRLLSVILQDILNNPILGKEAKALYDQAKGSGELENVPVMYTIIMKEIEKRSQGNQWKLISSLFNPEATNQSTGFDAYKFKEMFGNSAIEIFQKVAETKQGSDGGEENKTDEITQAILENLAKNTGLLKKLHDEAGSFGPSLDTIFYWFYLDMDKELRLKPVEDKKQLSSQLSEKISDEQKNQIWDKINELLGKKTDTIDNQGSAGGESDVDERLKPYLVKYQQIIGDGLDSIILATGEDELQSKLIKSFIIYFLQEKAKLNEPLDSSEQGATLAALAKLFAKQFYEEGDYVDDFANYLQSREAQILEFLDTNKSLEKFKSSSTSQGADQQDTETSESSVDPEVIAKLEKLLNETDPKLLPIVNKYPKFKKLLVVAYAKALKEKPEDTATTPETSTPETSTAKPSPQPATPASDTGGEVAGAMGESINRALSGIFLIENTDGDKTSSASAEGGTEDEVPAPTNTDTSDKTGTQDGAPISVKDAAEVEKMLKELEALFAKAKLEINVRTIWNLSQVKRTEPEDEQEPSMDDVSKPDIAEFNENWTEVLMTFFGKNPDRSSFMRRLLLRSQSEMLYETINVLEQIADPAEMKALTRMNQNDEKEKLAAKQNDAPPESDNSEDSENKDEKPANKPKTKNESLREELRDVFPQIRTGTNLNLKDPKPDNETDDDEVEDPQPEPEQTQPEPEVEQDEVELPPKTRRMIKQDLQSMVNLLRKLKQSIGRYKDFSTSKSVDPRYDGSTLKKNMDQLLVQVQEDIYDLHTNIKEVDLEPETDDQSLEEALSGIMLEEDDPERQAKIDLVEETYNNAKREYIYVLMPSMENGDWDESVESSKKILEILKEEEFIGLFPTGMKSAGGKVITVGKAYEVMTEIIQKFIETVRDIVLISKKKYIAKSSLSAAKLDLYNISKDIARLFQVPHNFSEDEVKKMKEEEAANPDSQSITPESRDNLDQEAADNKTATPAPESSSTTEPSADEDNSIKIEEYLSSIEVDIDKMFPASSWNEAMSADDQGIEEKTNFFKFGKVYQNLEIDNIYKRVLYVDMGMDGFGPFAKKFVDDGHNGFLENLKRSKEKLVQSYSEKSSEYENAKTLGPNSAPQYAGALLDIASSNLQEIAKKETKTDKDFYDVFLYSKIIPLLQQEVEKYLGASRSLKGSTAAKLGGKALQNALTKYDSAKNYIESFEGDTASPTKQITMSSDASGDGVEDTEEVDSEVTEEYYETEVNNSTFKDIKKIVEKYFSGSSPKDKLYAFNVGRAFTKAYLEDKSNENPDLEKFIKSLEKRGKFDESNDNKKEDEDVDYATQAIEAELWKLFQTSDSADEDISHQNAFNMMSYIGDGIPKGAGEFLKNENNKDYYSDLITYSKLFHDKVEKELRKRQKRETLEETLKPIIEKMLKEHYNH